MAAEVHQRLTNGVWLRIVRNALAAGFVSLSYIALPRALIVVSEISKTVDACGPKKEAKDHAP